MIGMLNNSINVRMANSRIAFDLYEMISNQRIGVEEPATINAEFLG